MVVKRIYAHFARDRHLLDMFLEEQRVAATLRHDNIVRTYDVGEVDGKYFISMEYLPGEDVRRIFRAMRRLGRALPLDVAIAIVLGAAAGLGYAHRKTGVDLAPLDIVHRDVSPHNLIVTYDGRVVIVDFGVAKARSHRSVTSSGTVKGKIPYMAPEQCQGLPVDRRADLYALGVILYELSTTTRMYPATLTDFELMRRIVDEPPPAAASRLSGYPPRLEAIARRALEKDPARRYQTAGELAADLSAFAADSGLEPTREKVRALMHELFAAEIAAWREAAGDPATLAQYLAHKHSYRDGGPGGEAPSADDILAGELPASGDVGGDFLIDLAPSAAAGALPARGVRLGSGRGVTPASGRDVTPESDATPAGATHIESRLPSPLDGDPDADIETEIFTPTPRRGSGAFARHGSRSGVALQPASPRSEPRDRARSAAERAAPLGRYTAVPRRATAAERAAHDGADGSDPAEPARRSRHEPTDPDADGAPPWVWIVGVAAVALAIVAAFVVAFLLGDGA